MKRKIIAPPPGLVAPVSVNDLERLVYNIGSELPYYHIAIYDPYWLEDNTDTIYVKAGVFPESYNVEIGFIDCDPFTGIYLKPGISDFGIAKQVAVNYASRPTAANFPANATYETSNGVLTITDINTNDTDTVRIGRIVSIFNDGTYLVIGYIDQNDITFIGSALPVLSEQRKNDRIHSLEFDDTTEPIPQAVLSKHLYRLYYIAGTPAKFILAAYDVSAVNLNNTTTSTSLSVKTAKMESNQIISVSYNSEVGNEGVVFDTSNEVNKETVAINLTAANLIPGNARITTDKGVVLFENNTGTVTYFQIEVGRIVSLKRTEAAIIVGYVDQNDITLT